MMNGSIRLEAPSSFRTDIYRRNVASCFAAEEVESK